MRLFFYAIILLFSYVLPAYALDNTQVEQYALDYNKSRISFRAILTDHVLEGVFKQFRGDIAFDDKEASNSRFFIEVDVNSVKISDSKYYADLLSPDWLYSTRFGKATFESKNVNRIPKTNDFYGDGVMTLRGITKPVTFNFKQEFNNGERAVVKGYVTLQRKDFGIGPDDQPVDEAVKKTVRVDFRLHVSKLPQ